MEETPSVDFYEPMNLALIEALNAIPQMKAENPEIEFRLGLINPADDFFKADIPKELFDRLLSTFKHSSEWTHKENLQSTDYFIKDNRLTHCEKGYLYIKKKKLGSYNFSNNTGGIDVRLAVASEIPVKIPKKYEKKTPSETECTLIRHKERFTFVYDVWRYDLTVLSLPGNPEKKFEFELELVDPKKAVYKYNVNYLATETISKIKNVIELLD